MADTKQPTAFTQQPSSLQNPVPQQDVKNLFDGLAAEAQELDLGANTQAQDPNNLVAQQQDNRQAIAGKEPDFFKNLESEIAQKEEAFDPRGEMGPVNRAQASFATTQRELINFVSKKYGDNNARLTERGVEWRHDPSDPWKNIDNETVTNISDFLDYSRPIAEGVIENVGRVGGFIGGAGQGAAEGAAIGTAVAPGLGTVTGSAGMGLINGLLGATAGGAVGSVAAINFADHVQEEWLDIERDPERSAAIENTVAAGLGAGFNFVAAKSARKFSAAKIKAKQLGETINNVRERVEDLTANIDIVNKLGLRKVNGKLKFMPNQMAGDIVPELDEAAKALSTENGYRNYVQKQGELIKEAYQSIAELVGNVRGLGDPKLAEKVNESVFSSRAHEGRIIGEFRQLALRNSKDRMKGVEGARKYIPGRAAEVYNNLLSELGRTVDNPRIDSLSTDEITEAMPDLTRDEARGLIGIIKDIHKLSGPSGEMSLARMDNLYTGMRDKLDTLFKSRKSLSLASRMVKLKNALRDDWTDAIGVELEDLPEAKQAYKDAMGRFSAIAGSMDELTKKVLSDGISREAFVKQIFPTALGQGGLGAKQLAAMRTLIQERDPDLWREMTGDYFRTLLDSNTDSVTGAVKWSSMSKAYNKLGEGIRKEIFSGTDYKPEVMDALFNVGQYYERSQFKPLLNAVAPSVPGKIVRALVVLFSNTLSTQKADTAADLINTLGGKDKLLTQYLNSGGIEEIAKFIPQAQRANALVKMRNYVDMAVDRATFGKGTKTDKMLQGLSVMGGELTESRAKDVIKGAAPAVLKTNVRSSGTDLVKPGKKPNR